MAAPSAKSLIDFYARKYGVQPRIAETIALGEGGLRFGSVGDGGHAFGPFQMNDAGGVLTGRPGNHAAFANSAAGIAAAVRGIAKAVGGATGLEGVRRGIYYYERPLDKAGSFARARQNWGRTGISGTPTPNGGDIGYNPGPTANPNPLAGNPMSGMSQQAISNIWLKAAAATLSGKYADPMTMFRSASQAAQAAPVASATPSRELVRTSTGLPSGLAGGFLPQGAQYIQGRGPDQGDHGRDLTTNPGGKIIAPGAGTVLAVNSDPSGFGPSYPVIRFTSGPYKGRTMYIGHVIATVKPGQSFGPGTPLGVTGTHGVGSATTPGWAEIGFGMPGTKSYGVGGAPFGK